MRSDIILITYTVYFVDGVLNRKEPRKVHINTASAEEKDEFKKKGQVIFVDTEHEKKKRKDFTIVSLDESILFLTIL